MNVQLILIFNILFVVFLEPGCVRSIPGFFSPFKKINIAECLELPNVDMYICVLTHNYMAKKIISKDENAINVRVSRDIHREVSVFSAQNGLKIGRVFEMAAIGWMKQKAVTQKKKLSPAKLIIQK